MTVEIFIQHLANGISLGSLYALIAIGYTLVYGILRLINFAHGDIFMMAAYFAFFGIASFGLPWIMVFPLSILLTGILGVCIERFAYRPLRNAPKISILISAIGVSYLLQNLATVLFSGIQKAFPQIEIFTNVIKIGNIYIQNLTFIIPIVTLLLLIGLNYLVHKTKGGMALRAVQRDYDTSKLMGIHVNHMISLTFFIGSMLAAFGAIMWSLKYPQINPFMGLMPGLKCFIAAVIGGIGSIKGAVMGGFLLGIGEILIVALIPALSGYRDAFAFVLLILILLIKPTGLVGEKIAEKV